MLTFLVPGELSLAACSPLRGELSRLLPMLPSSEA